MQGKAAAVALPLLGADDPFWALWSSYERHLRAEQRGRRTLEAYGRMARHWHRYLVEHHVSTDPAEHRRQHVESFLIYLREELAHAPATIHLAYASLSGFYRWAVEEEEVRDSPLARLKAPQVDQPPPAVLTDDDIAGLLRTCQGPATTPGELFLNRRDAALIRFLADTGLRRNEALGIRLEDVNTRDSTVRVTRKGAREGLAFYGVKAGRDLDRYLRVRARQSAASSPFLWLPGSRGGQVLGETGLAAMLVRRAKLAGLDAKVHPHAFRHVFADRLKAGGASDEDVMVAGGWRDAKIMRRYAAARAVDRARDTHRRLSPGDRI